jgi:hypothetical protein
MHNCLEYGPIATLITNNLGALGFWTLDPTTTQEYPNKHSNILQSHTQAHPPASIEFLQGHTQTHSTTNLDDLTYHST